MKWLIPVLLLGIFLRTWHLSTLPNGLHWDEMDTGYQAYSLLQTGRDYFGSPLPFFLHSFADFRTPVYIYSAVPSVALFGLTPLGVRLPSVIYGVLSILVIYVLSVLLFKHRGAALFAALTMALSPWAIQYSRQSVETISATFLLMLGVATFRSRLIASSLFFCLSMAAYSPPKLFVPLFLLVLVVLNRNYLSSQTKKTLTFATLLLCAFATILIGDTFFGQSGLRAKQLSIFTDPTVATQVNYERQRQQLSAQPTLTTGLRPGILELINYNKPVLWAKAFTTNYLKTFSLGYLFLTGDQEIRHSPGKDTIGMLHIVEIIPLLVGLYYLAKHKQFVIIAWLLLAPIPGSLTRWDNPHAARLFILLPPLILAIGLGISKLKNVWLLGYLVTLSLSCVFYASYFFANYSWESAQPFHWGFSEVITRAVAAQPNYTQVLVDGGREPMLMSYLFTTKFPPKTFQSLQPIPQQNLKDGVVGFQFGNLFILSPGSRNWRDLHTKFPGSKLLFAAADQDQAKNLPATNTIYYPDSTPAFYEVKF